MIKFGIKSAIAGGAVYYLADQGLWKESEESTKLYGKLQNAVAPYVSQAKSQVPFQIPELPKSDYLPNLTAECWNKGVKATFQFIGNLPSETNKLVQKGVDAALANKEVKNILSSTADDGSKPKK